jgi:DNA polymerase-3 subunit delta'
MTAFRTRGHPAAVAAIAAMIRGHVPHAILLVGPRGVGKTTLATDIAAGLLCTAAYPAERPCGACRGCRLVASGGHPDIHRLGPDGAGRQVVIGGPGAPARGIRDLIVELSLTPVEGGARVAIVTSAHRMNEDAQAALLKTLEEPGSGVVIILCADVEEPILPTIRSRSARLRLGPVATREVEALLAETGAADPPLAARLARIAGGRPGIAMAWARQPDAVLAREQLARTLLDMTDQRPSARLASMRAAMPLAVAVAAIDDGRDEAGVVASTASGATAPAGGKSSSRRRTAVAAVAARTDDGTETDPEAGVAPARATAAERRRATEAVVAVWTDLARDLVVIARGMPGAARDIDLLDETRGAAPGQGPDRLLGFLERLGRATTLLAGNVSPELVLDDLVLAWPAARR